MFIAITGPVTSNDPTFDVTVMRPIRRPAHPAVFNRVVVYVIDMLFKIGIVTNLMFPIATLPDAPFTFFCAARVHFLTPGQQTRKSGLYQRPAHRVIRVARRQTPDGVQVFWQNHHRDDRKGMSLFDFIDDGSQIIDMAYKGVGFSIRQIHRKEIGCTFRVGAPVMQWVVTPVVLLGFLRQPNLRVIRDFKFWFYRPNRFAVSALLAFAINKSASSRSNKRAATSCSVASVNFLT